MVGPDAVRNNTNPKINNCKGVEAYVMDASAIDAPFLLSKIANHCCSNSNNSNAPPSRTNDAEHRNPDTTPAEAGGLNRSQSGDTENSCPPTTHDGGSVDDDEPPAFDAVFTHAMLHWVKTPRTVIEGAKRVLRPGGRFVGEFGGHGNIAAVRVAMHAALWRRGIDPLEVDPFYFPSPEEYRTLLESVSVSLARRLGWENVEGLRSSFAMSSTTGCRKEVQ